MDRFSGVCLNVEKKYHHDPNLRSWGLLSLQHFCENGCYLHQVYDFNKSMTYRKTSIHCGEVYVTVATGYDRVYTYALRVKSVLPINY